MAGCSAGGDSAGGTRDPVVASPGVAGQAAGAGGSNAGTDFGNGAVRAGAPAVAPTAPAMPTPAAAGGTIEPVSIDQCLPSNPAGLGEADAQKLMAGSGDAGGLRFLYPYDGTVFPRGVLAPLLMWEGGNADAVYVHIKASRFEYRGCLKPTAPGQLQLPQDVWDTAGLQTQGPGDPFALELSTMAGGAAAGPIRQQFVIAQATIKGSIFYNSYSSALPASGLAAGGSVLRIPPGGTAERFVSNECNGCHSVSVNGARMLSQTLGTGGRSYTLAPNAPPDPPPMQAGMRAAYGALYPDGSVYLATSTRVEIARAALTSPGSNPAATLFDTDTGAERMNTGIPEGALMPMFSPDGTHLVFNDFALGEAHGLALMDYDGATHTASNYRTLYMDSGMRPGWPFVLPDNRAVVFTRTDGGDFSGEGAGLIGVPVGPVSDLHIVDVASGTTNILARAMGFATPADAASNTTYLPFGAEDLHKNYFPTVSPVAAGGYFWVFFDSVRHYGNLGLQRQLWGAAIEIAADGDYSVDRSAPAFYLPGQEFGTGNHRAFAALDPCKQNGDACTSGTDCCGGFCSVPEPDEFGEAVGTCSSDVPECARTNERCTSDADCCPPENGERMNSCIAGFCASVRAPD